MTPGRRSTTASPTGGPVCSADGPAVIEMAIRPERIRFGRLLQHRTHADARVQRVLLAGAARKLLQDLSTAQRLGAQQTDILAQRAVAGERVLELLRHQRDRRQRRAELVRGGGGETVERVQFLLARQHEVGRGQRRRHLPGFLGEPPGIEREERRRSAHRGEGAELVDQRQLEGEASVPRKRLVKDDENPGGG